MASVLAVGRTGYFYPRSPCGERRLLCYTMLARLYFYPRSPCGERRWLRCWQLAARDISIHALLAESDITQFLRLRPKYPFLSTLSLRRATSLLALLICPPPDFYPRSPCGERRLCTILYSCPGNFYPRSPCGERQPAEHHASNQQEFLSTLSLRRATTFA